MQYTLHTHHIELTAEDTTLLEKKLNRLEKHVRPPFTLTIGLRRDTHHKKGNIITCSATLHHGKKIFHAEREATTIQDCLDEVLAALQKELEKEHGKAKDKHTAY